MPVAVAFDAVLVGGLQRGRVTVVGAAGDTGLNTVDLVQPRDAAYAQRMLARAVTSTLRGRAIRVVAAEDYLVLKVLSTRERDLDDAVAVVHRSRDILDLPLVAAELRAVEGVLPDVQVAPRRAVLEQQVGRLAP